MKDQFTPIMRRTRRWKFEGGTTELMLGGIFFWAAMYFLLQLLPAISPATIFSIVLCGLVGTMIVPAFMQRRYVFPRSGYVEYKETTRRGIWKPLLLAAGAGVFVAFLFYEVLLYDYDHAFAWGTAIVGIFIGLAWIIGNINFRIRRLTYLGFFSLALGLLVSPVVLGAEFTRGEYLGGILLGTYFLLMGIAFFVSGGFAFRAFLRRNPLKEESSDE
jgi:hypothetical protein